MPEAEATTTTRKKARNLPKKFDLKIAAPAPEETPATTGGDYLDLEGAPRAAAAPLAAAYSEAPLARDRVPVPLATPETQPRAPDASNRNEPRRASTARRTTPERAPARKTYKKRNINVSRETEVRWDEVLKLMDDQIEDGLKQSDVFEALAQITHGARAEINLSRVRRRGAWGTAQVNAFRTNLRLATEEAIVRNYLKKRGVDFDSLNLEDLSGA